MQMARTTQMCMFLSTYIHISVCSFVVTFLSVCISFFSSWKWSKALESEKKNEIKINFQIYVDLWSYIILNYSCSCSCSLLHCGRSYSNWIEVVFGTRAVAVYVSQFVDSLKFSGCCFVGIFFLQAIRFPFLKLHRRVDKVVFYTDTPDTNIATEV